jgi:chaperonin cofactor prefoldin
MTKIKELEVRVGMMEKQDAAIMDKLDDLTEIIQQLRIDLQNKSDRK